MTQSDVAWKRFFDTTGGLKEIGKDGYLLISAKDLKKYGRREPRLMAKHDTLESRPKIFREQKLSILPIKNGEYIIFQDLAEKSFYSFSESDYSTSPTTYISKTDLSSFLAYPRNHSFNESQSLDFAIISSLFREFSGEDNLKLTSRGRIYSGQFSIAMPQISKEISVSGVQIELDGGYENENAMLLVEAKIGRRQNFNIRQLLYPYLEWQRHNRKRLHPIFMVFTNGQYYFFEFSFSNEFGIVELVRKSHFTLNNLPKKKISIPTLLQQVPEGKEPIEIPFPQADDFDKVLDTVTLARGEGISKSDFADYYGIHDRQGDYYPNAARYIGLLEKIGQKFVLSNDGKVYLDLPSKVQQLDFVIRKLVEKPIFREIIKQFHDSNYDVDVIDTNSIVNILESRSGRKLSGMTLPRRVKTIVSWLDWTSKNLDLTDKKKV